MVIYNGILEIMPGMREEYLKALIESDLVNIFLKQEGCVYYVIGASIMDDNNVVICDGWESRETFENHDQSQEVVTIWRELYSKYVVNEQRRLYEV